ncbi:hypothetical protein NHX12_025790 [Muraenolepis orangiensis]|uniref:G-protein coupled receptors family 1 profile domain-containing protein n=1 Tax=Muraenolepis orangiensis TaxID=630683 RepID=A0A9Q0EFB6_9TELE|nr:hypothetical protein NHX12_025790 [Muraenolepis orangiensis]
MIDPNLSYSGEVQLAHGGNLSMCTPPPYEHLRLPLVVLYSAVVLVGLPANVLTVWLTWRQVRRKSVLAVYLCSLSLCDLTYLCTLPLWALYIFSDHKWPWGSTVCKVTGFLFFTNMYVSVLLLCCVSCDRYVAVGYALESRGRRSRRVAALVTVAIVAAVTMAHVPVFVMREGEAEPRDGEAEPRDGKGQCFEPNHSPTTSVTALNYARFLLGFLAPLVLLATTNRGVLCAVQASHSLSARQKGRVRALAYAVVTLFLVCFAPYHLVLLARAVSSHLLPRGAGEENCGFSWWIQSPYSISLGLSALNCACNPILYVLSSEDVRKELSVALSGRGGGVAGDHGAQGTRGTLAHTTAWPPLGAEDALQGLEHYSSLDNVYSETRGVKAQTLYPSSLWNTELKKPALVRKS